LELLAYTQDPFRLPTYFTSRCTRCFRHRLQYFFNSTRSGEFRLFFMVE